MNNEERLLAIIEKAQIEKSLAEQEIEKAKKIMIYADAKIEVANEMLKEEYILLTTEENEKV